MKILKPLLIIGAILAILLLMFLGIYADARETVKIWNKGICNECGGSYEFRCMEGGYKRNDRFVFQCSDCHKLIILKYNPYPTKRGK